MRTKLNTLEGNNYILLYPALIGGEWLAHSLSMCVPDYNHNPSTWIDQHANIQCYTNFTQNEPFINPVYEYDPSKSIIVRDHINPELYKYEQLPGLTPIILYSNNIDMWWHRRWRTLYKYVNKDILTVDWLQENVNEECDLEFLEELQLIVPDTFTVPDVILYWETGQNGFTRSHDDRRKDNIRHIREHMNMFTEFEDLFNPAHTLNMDHVYTHWNKFAGDCKQIFPELDTKEFYALWSKWLERNS